MKNIPLFVFLETQTGRGEAEHTQSGNQIGGNFNPDHFIGKIADIVTQRLVQFRPPSSNWKSYERAEPTISSEVLQANTSPPSTYDIHLKQNDQADKFDEESLLKLIPKRFKGQAATLLKIFDDRSDEVTYRSDGVLFINGESVPNSNVKKLFPALYQKKASKEEGMNEFVSQLMAMGLQHLFPFRLREKPVAITRTATTEYPPEWWYLD